MPTEIAWTDETWNPTTGCDRVSPGCDNCYAMTLAKRLKAMGQAKYQNDGDPRTSGLGFALTMHDDALDLPLHWRKPRRVFVNSMSDLFHPKVDDDFIGEVFTTMGRASRHTFQVLTKRPQRMAKLLDGMCWEGVKRVNGFFLNGQVDPGDLSEASVYFTDTEGETPLPNVWLGTSIENQRYADVRIRHLQYTPAAVRFLSMEPLLGPVDLLPYLRRISDEARAASEYEWDTSHRIGWVIIGGESGPGARPMQVEWAEQIVDECRHWGVAVFVKQLGSVLGGKRHADIDTFPASLQVREYPGASA